MLEVVDAVATALAAATFSQTIAVAATHYFDYDPGDVAAYTVKVLPNGEVWDGNDSRASTLDTVRIKVVLFKKVDPSSKSAMDACVTLLDEIKRYLCPQAGGTTYAPTNYTWMRTDNDPLYDTEELYSRGVYRGAATITYMR